MSTECINVSHDVTMNHSTSSQHDDAAAADDEQERRKNSIMMWVVVVVWCWQRWRDKGQETTVRQKQ